MSGGQSGVDRAALDAAMAAGLHVGGWCPAGRRAEDGAIPAQYPLRETPSTAYRVRTRLNVRDAEATLIVAPLPLVGGTAYTARVAQRLNVPVFHLAINAASNPRLLSLAPVRAWLTERQVSVLNVAGPRESTVPGIYAVARVVLARLFEEQHVGPSPAAFHTRGGV